MLVDGVLDGQGLLAVVALDAQLVVHLAQNPVGVGGQDVVAQRHAGKQVVIAHPGHAAHAQRPGRRIAGTMDQPRAVVQQVGTVEGQCLVDHVVGIGQPLLVARGKIDLPGRGGPADVVAHDGPLPLALHDDAVTVYHGPQRRHRLVGLQRCQAQEDRTVQAAVVALTHGKTACRVDGIHDMVHRHIVQGIHQGLLALILGHQGRTLFSHPPRTALDKTDADGIDVAVQAVEAGQSDIGLDAVGLGQYGGEHRILDDTVARECKGLVLNDDTAAHLVAAATSTQHQRDTCEQGRKHAETE